ncbi:plasmid partitioning protein RepB C-terminal domain-containing protein, partial [Ensifer sp. 2YAB10]|uniref:plasmid partitioning protein RepB C-terminal domain-containing protein n=1 Tax=Ensifer sp. 2YAB10 TaxID=3233021 RepID=UPI003F93D88A
LMVAANSITVAYAEALLVATPAPRLIDGKKPARLTGVSQEQMAKMEREMSNLQEQYKLVEQTYGQDVLNLVLARGYLAKLLECEPVLKYLSQRQPDLVREFDAILEIVSLDQ